MSDITPGSDGPATEREGGVRVDPALHERRERVFLVLASFFICAMTMLNILGVSRFLDFSFDILGVHIPVLLAVGVLPYPLTFLCTDFISELYGRKRARLLVWLGFAMNVFIALFLWAGGLQHPESGLGPDGLPPTDDYTFAFYRIRQFTLGLVAASMVAYLSAQMIDVYMFHFWKRMTRGRHLWLRNNGSTLVSQFVDSFAVMTLTHFGAGGLPVDETLPLWPQLWTFIFSAYIFKLLAALVDTGPFYLGTAWLSRYLQIDPMREHDRGDEVGRRDPVRRGSRGTGQPG